MPRNTLVLRYLGVIFGFGSQIPYFVPQNEAHEAHSLNVPRFVPQKCLKMRHMRHKVFLCLNLRHIIYLSRAAPSPSSTSTSNLIPQPTCLCYTLFKIQHSFQRIIHPRCGPILYQHFIFVFSSFISIYLFITHYKVF